ncbi:hypothetical protein EVAR_96875_1 [Eumeta japonica]|uniref:Uncharacterized protein n=1 Tax=Eumeta variegata TaxID=151549 RepID=A0A4C1WNX2_EUMVA|nr:hypothetical protein EVAR_96875_1 [Eumeta japonica]
MRSGNRRGRGLGRGSRSGCARHLPPATAIITRRGPLHTVQVAYVADRCPSDVNVPPTTVKAARIGDLLHADLTEHATNR